jgi:hypothetical protein
MDNLSIELRNLYRAIGELSYVLARNDGSITTLEKTVFEEAIKEELGKESWVAKDRFDSLINQGLKADVLKTYNHVLYIIRQNKYVLNDDLIERFIAVLEKVAGVSGITDEEIQMIEKFREDIFKIYQEA